VLPGQQIDPMTPLGQKQSPGRLVPVDVAGPLGIDVAMAASTLCVRVGERVAAGSVLAERTGLRRRRTVVAPSSGQVVAMVAGCLLLREDEPESLIYAGLDAQVAKVSDGAVTLVFSGTRVRCAWASGAQACGALTLATANGVQELTWPQVGRHLVGAVLVGGWLSDERAVRRARQFGLAGLLVGSVDAALVSDDWGLPVLATEGLGVTPMASTTFAALAQMVGRSVWLCASGREGSPYAAVAHAVREERGLVPLAVGARVHLIRAPYLGQVGQIVDLPASARRTALGTLAEGALVALESGQRVFVPWPNLEPAC